MGALLASRFGLAGIVAVLAGLVIGALGLSLHWTRAELDDALMRAATLEAAVKMQNDAVMALQDQADAAKAAADARARAALAPRPKPNTATVEDLNTWLVSP